MKIECPKCKQHLDVPEAYFGQSLGCPSCNVNLAIPFAMQPAAPEPVAAAVPAHAEEEAVVPAAPVQKTTPPPPPPPPMPVSGQKKARPAKPAKSSKKKGTIIAVSVGGLLVVGAIVLIVIFGVPILGSKPAAKEVAWTFEAAEGPFGMMSSGFDTTPAIGKDGTIYATAMAGVVYAIDQASGQKIWEYKINKPDVGSPVVDENGVVYVAAKGIFALDGTTGAKLWDNASGASFSFGKYLTAPVIVPGGLLVAVYQDLSEDENLLRTFDSKSGDQKWEFELEEIRGLGNKASTPAVANDGTIYFGRGDVFLALDGKTGKKKWDFATGRGRGLFSSNESSPAIGADGTVYFGGRDGKVYALNGKTGDKIWDQNVDSSVNGSPAIGPNGLVVISYGSGIVALDGKSGEEKWNHSLGAFSFTDYDGDPVVGNNGRVYIGSAGMSRGEKSSHGLVVFDGTSGAKLWTAGTGKGSMLSGVSGGITMSSNGTIFFGGLDNKLYCVGTEATGPADSSWPMFGGNAQNTGNVSK